MEVHSNFEILWLRFWRWNSDPEWGWSGLFFTTDAVRVDFLERRYEREWDVPGGGPWEGGVREVLQGDRFVSSDSAEGVKVPRP